MKKKNNAAGAVQGATAARVVGLALPRNVVRDSDEPFAVDVTSLEGLSARERALFLDDDDVLVRVME